MTKEDRGILQEILENTKSLIETVNFLKDTAVHRDDFNEFKHEMYGFKEEMFVFKDKTEGRLTKIEALMVTKDYLDRKLFELRGDLVMMIRRGDGEVKVLVDVLRKRSVISANDVSKVFRPGAFPESN